VSFPLSLFEWRGQVGDVTEEMSLLVIVAILMGLHTGEATHWWGYNWCCVLCAAFLLLVPMLNWRRYSLCVATAAVTAICYCSLLLLLPMEREGFGRWQRIPSNGLFWFWFFFSFSLSTLFSVFVVTD